MASIMSQGIEHIDSAFHKDLIGNVDGLIQHLEASVALLESREGDSDRKNQHDSPSNGELWDKTTGHFNTVLGGLQAFITGLRFEYSSLGTEADELGGQRKALEVERDDLIEKSHELHCRIQYNALEMKLDQSFSDIERCSSVESARCFKEEAHENLRRTREIIRTANLRNCRLDKEIFNEMECITSTFQEYQKERDTYVKELDLLDDVRRRKINNWMNDSTKTGVDRELGENMIEYMDLSSSRRHFEPKIISNTLRMQSMNESLAYDRQDNHQRLAEMMTLQAKVDSMTGLNNILPRKTTAVTDLAGMNDDGGTCRQQPSNDDDAYSDFLELECQAGQHVTSGNGLHRCPRKINLATDPITDPKIQQELEAVLRWEVNDGVYPSTTAGAGVGWGDPATDGGTATTTSEDLQDPASTSSRPSEKEIGEEVVEEDGGDDDDDDDDDEEKEVVENVVGGGSNTSVCGDAELSQGKQAGVDPTCNDRHFRPLHPSPNGAGVTGNATELPVPRSSHLMLHHVESATGRISAPQQKLMFGLVKKKSCGGPSSMTAIVDGDKEAAAGRMTSQGHRQAAADDRDTRSQGCGSSGGGRAGGSGTSNNSGNPRN